MIALDVDFEGCGFDPHYRKKISEYNNSDYKLAGLTSGRDGLGIC